MKVLRVFAINKKRVRALGCRIPIGPIVIPSDNFFDLRSYVSAFSREEACRIKIKGGK